METMEILRSLLGVSWKLLLGYSEDCRVHSESKLLDDKNVEDQTRGMSLKEGLSQRV